MGLNDGSVLYSDTDLDAPQRHELPGGVAMLYTRRSPAKETVNEDALAVIRVADEAVVLVVADGLGGQPAGNLASATLVRVLAENLPAATPPQLREAILDSIEQANRQILDTRTGAATTVAVVELRHNMLRSYHAGDSGLLVTGQRGRLRLQTVPHSPTGYAQEAGLLDEVEALTHPERNLVLNVVGSDSLRIETGPLLKLATFDTLVIASDGLFDNLLSHEIIERVRCGALDQAAGRLVDDCRARMTGRDPQSGLGHPDDLSFILYRLAGRQ